MRILLYSRVFPPAVGGMERFAEDLAGWLVTAGHEVVVATQTSANGSSDEARPYSVLRRPGPGVVVRAMRWADVVHVTGLSVRGIATAIASGRRPVAKHAGHQAVCPGGLAWNPAGTCTAGPRVGPCRFCPERGWAAKGKVLVHRAAAAAAAANVCVSRYLAQRVAVPRATVIYNPVSFRAFAAGTAEGQEEGDLIAFAGRLVEEKGLDLLLRALALVPGIRLEVAGDGPLRQRLEGLARDLGIRSRVSFLGALTFEGVAELYARAALVCVPSVWHEPFGYAAAEAMAMGRPVVATPNGALRELLGDGRGFLAETASPAALAAAISSALADSRARARAGAAARAFALSELAMDVVGPRYLDLYRRAGS